MRLLGVLKCSESGHRSVGTWGSVRYGIYPITCLVGSLSPCLCASPHSPLGSEGNFARFCAVATHSHRSPLSDRYRLGTRFVLAILLNQVPDRQNKRIALCNPPLWWCICYALPRVRCRRPSKRIMLPATPTFSDSAPPCIGIPIWAVAFLCALSLRPWASFPKMSAVGWRQSTA